MGFKDWKNQKWFPYTVASCSAVLLFVILTNLSSIGSTMGKVYHFFSPVVIGVVLAYIVEPFVARLQNSLFRKIKSKKLNRSLSVTMTLVIVTLLLVLILATLIPQLIGSISMFVSNFDTYVDQLQAWLEKLNVGVLRHIDLSGFIETNLSTLTDLESQLPEYLDTLEDGDHTVSVVLKDGTPVTATFTTKTAISPMTGDAAPGVLWIMELVGALTLMLYEVRKRRV